MKWINLILALYLTSIAFMPCGDDYASADSGNTVFTAQADNHPEPLDICSPLCICSCCAGFSHINHNTVVQSGVLAFFVSPGLSAYQEKHLLVYSSIWQPPKV